MAHGSSSGVGSEEEDDDPDSYKQKNIYFNGRTLTFEDQVCLDAIEDWTKEGMRGKELFQQYGYTLTFDIINRTRPRILQKVRDHLLENGVPIKPRHDAPCILALREMLEKFYKEVPIRRQVEECTRLVRTLHGMYDKCGRSDGQNIQDLEECKRKYVHRCSELGIPEDLRPQFLHCALAGHAKDLFTDKVLPGCRGLDYCFERLHSLLFSKQQQAPLPSDDQQVAREKVFEDIKMPAAVKEVSKKLRLHCERSKRFRRGSASRIRKRCILSIQRKKRNPISQMDKRLRRDGSHKYKERFRIHCRPSLLSRRFTTGLKDPIFGAVFDRGKLKFQKATQV